MCRCCCQKQEQLVLALAAKRHIFQSHKRSFSLACGRVEWAKVRDVKEPVLGKPQSFSVQNPTLSRSSNLFPSHGTESASSAYTWPTATETACLFLALVAWASPDPSCTEGSASNSTAPWRSI